MFNNVLIALDLNHDESWRKALPVALDICRHHGATLHAVTVIPELHMPMIASYFPADFTARLVESTNTRLGEFVRSHVPDPVQCTHAVVSGGTVYELILQYADEHGVDLIVLEAYRPDFKDYLLGSNAEKVVRHAQQSVLVVRE